MKMSYLITVAVGAVMIGSAAACVTWYTVKYEQAGITAVEAWVITRIKRRELNRELVKIVGHAKETEGA